MTHLSITGSAANLSKQIHGWLRVLQRLSACRVDLCVCWPMALASKALVPADSLPGGGIACASRRCLPFSPGKLSWVFYSLISGETLALVRSFCPQSWSANKSASRFTECKYSHRLVLIFPGFTSSPLPSCGVLSNINPKIEMKKQKRKKRESLGLSATNIFNNQSPYNNANF